MKTALSMKQRNWLVGQMEIWLGQNLLEPEQAAGILANYESQEESSGRRRSILMTTLMSLAALMVGLAALLLIAHNWVEIPRGGKLTLIFAAIAGTYGAAFLANREGRSKRAVDAILLLASLFYGGGIFLVAQIFHMSAHYPNAILWWAIGVAPLAFCRRSLALDGLYAALLAT
ncbi:MAG: DUF2157 domain-containing protein, partial [Verrucomicrobiae bacterium]|nr:DUF2157 domain-containing protein [Verrucomicrobiae bacterium]